MMLIGKTLINMHFGVQKMKIQFYNGSEESYPYSQ